MSLQANISNYKRIQFLLRTKKWQEIVNEMSSYCSDKDKVITIAARILENIRSRFRHIQLDWI